MSTTFMWFLTSAILIVPSILRTKLAATEFALEELALFGQLSQLQTTFVVMGVGGFATAAKVILGRNSLEEETRSGIQSWLLVTPVALTFGIIALACSCLNALSLWISGDTEYAPIIFITLLSLPFSVMSQQSLAFAQAGLEQTTLLIAASLATVVSSIATIFLMSSGNLYAGASSFLVAAVVQSLTISSLSRSVRRNLLSRPRILRSIRREVFSISVSSLFVGVFAASAELTMRGFVVSEFGLASLSIYLPAALMATQLFGMILSPLASSTMISIARATPHETKKLLTALQTSMVPIVSLCAGLALAFSPELVSIFFSPSLSDTAVPILAIAFSVEIIRSVMWTLAAALLPHHARRSWLGISSLTVGSQLVVAIILIPSLGVPSLPVANGVGISIAIVVTQIRLRFLGIAPKMVSTTIGPLLAISLYSSYLITSQIESPVLMGPLLFSIALTVYLLTRLSYLTIFQSMRGAANHGTANANSRTKRRVG